jgi:predicted alpha/beta-hydrolase family hydrolase
LRSPSELRIALETGAATTALVYPSADTGIGAALILGHGAGAGQRSSFMVETARALSALGLDLITFNFLYAEQRRRIPDRAPVLEACYRSVIAAVRREIISPHQHLFIGGKSMGGRIATEVGASDGDLPISGLVLLGYPLHPPGRPQQRRDKHLPAIHHPMLFVQGARDAFGTPAELGPVLNGLPVRPTLHVVPGGDHSFKVAGVDAARRAAMTDEIYRTVVDWIKSVTGTSTPSRHREE